MTSGHFIFIPGVLVVGIAIGWTLAMRAVENRKAMEAEKNARRAARESQATDGE